MAEVRRRRVWWRGAAVGVAVSMLVGGCVGRDEEPVLVTAQEKDELGYERPELWRNSRLQALVVENREQIYSVVQPYVERELGVRVEMGRLSATYPSSTINVGWRTVEEPIFGGKEYVGIQPDGTVRSEASIGERGTSLGLAVFEAVYRMAYRERFEKFQAYLALAYPELMTGPPGSDETFDGANGSFTAWHYNPAPGAVPEFYAVQDAVWEAFKSNPVRSDDEWRELLDEVNAGIPMGISVYGMLADPEQEVTEELVMRLVNDLRENPLFRGFTEWSATVESNLQMRDDLYAHQMIWVRWIDETGRWLVSEKRNGATVR